MKNSKKTLSLFSNGLQALNKSYEDTSGTESYSLYLAPNVKFSALKSSISTKKAAAEQAAALKPILGKKSALTEQDLLTFFVENGYEGYKDLYNVQSREFKDTYNTLFSSRNDFINNKVETLKIQNNSSPEEIDLSTNVEASAPRSKFSNMRAVAGQELALKQILNKDEALTEQDLLTFFVENGYEGYKDLFNIQSREFKDTYEAIILSKNDSIDNIVESPEIQNNSSPVEKEFDHNASVTPIEQNVIDYNQVRAELLTKIKNSEKVSPEEIKITMGGWPAQEIASFTQSLIEIDSYDFLQVLCDLLGQNPVD